MPTLCPDSPEQLAEALHASAEAHRTIRVGGNFSKDKLGGAPCPADVTISTRALNRLLKYDPCYFTISVEAGMRFADLERILAGHRQMLPLDPGWAAEATVGGVVAANLSGPRRRQYGTARDMIIGMSFATLQGKLIQSGGMVVKNVAGLDMAKLMIGSFGTLAAIATVNFKVFPVPAESRTFVMRFESAEEAFAERDRILRSILQPTAIDIVNWREGFRLLIRAAGNTRVVERWTRELAHFQIADDSLWEDIHEFTHRFQGARIPIPCKLTEMAGIAAKLDVPFIARGGSGVIYAHYAGTPPAIELGGKAGDGSFAMMTKVKEMFDPERLLNRGRLYGRI